LTTGLPQREQNSLVSEFGWSLSGSINLRMGVA
jgi:hypothetical protein